VRRVVFIIVAIIGLVLGVPWHKYLIVREITVEGGERIQAETVLQSLPITVGTNWLTADTQAAREALLRLPDVRDALVRKRLWARIEIFVREREPLVLARLGQQLFWLDTEGFFYTPARQPFGPVLLEPQTIETPRGRRLAEPFYLVPLRALLSAPGKLLNHITTVRFEGSTMILTMRDGPDVLFQIYDVRGELVRLSRILNALDGHRLRRIDLRFERVLVVSEHARP
jgi:hypothetical protein